MHEKNKYYQDPATQVMAVDLQNRILETSLNADRAGYGTAIEEKWD